jgi:hypothetical protein
LDEKWMIDTWMLEKLMMNVSWIKNMDVKTHEQMEIFMKHG